MIPVDDNFVIVRGATGQNPKAYVLKPLKFELGKQVGIHNFFFLYAQFTKTPVGARLIGTNWI